MAGNATVTATATASVSATATATASVSVDMGATETEHETETRGSVRVGEKMISVIVVASVGARMTAGTLKATPATDAGQKEGNRTDAEMVQQAAVEAGATAEVKRKTAGWVTVTSL